MNPNPAPSASRSPRPAWAGLLLLLLAAAPLWMGCRRVQGSENASPTTPAVPAEAAPTVAAADALEAGRYLVAIAGCNDCHTPGYMEVNGQMPVSDWLTGAPVGFRGPWGTSYPSNLRLLVQDLPEDVFVEMVRARNALPPMPWVSLHAMSEQDVRAIYQFIHSLGPKGERMPKPVPPGQEPATPYIDFVPQHMERLAAPPTATAAPEAAAPQG